MPRGIIYVLTNPAMPDLVKIGKTTNLDQRLSTLYSTGVPLPFKCIYAKEVEDIDYVESKLHAAFDSTRLNARREFFKILEEEFHPFAWYHFCFTMDGYHYSVIVNGLLWFTDKLDQIPSKVCQYPNSLQN